MWRWEDVKKMWRCEDEKMWRWEDEKLEDVKMGRCEDEKMWWQDGWQTSTIRRTVRSDALGNMCYEYERVFIARFIFRRAPVHKAQHLFCCWCFWGLDHPRVRSKLSATVTSRNNHNQHRIFQNMLGCSLDGFNTCPLPSGTAKRQTHFFHVCRARGSWYH